MELSAFTNKVIKYRIAIIIAFGALVGIGLLQTARHLSVNNALTIWFLDNDPEYQEYLAFQKDQGSDQIVVAMVPIDTLFGTTHFEQLNGLHLQIDSLPFVHATFSLANFQYPLYANKKIYFRDFYTAERSTTWMQKTLDDLPAIRDQLLSSDDQYSFFYIQLDPNDVIETNRRAYVKGLVNTIQETVEGVHITGPPIINEAFSLTIYEESLFFAFITVVVILILLLFLLPHWHYLPIAFATVIVTVSITLGLMSTLGHSLNLISMLIPTILMVYAVSDTIHIINIFHVQRTSYPDMARNQQIAEALRKSLKPCFYTTLTTVVGYLALSLSPLPAFRVTGVFTFLGIAIAFCAAYLITAIGFSYLTPQSAQGKIKKINIGSIVQRINHWTSAHNTLVLGIGFLIFVIGIISISLLEVSTNSLHLLGQGKVKDDIELIENKLQGSSRLQLNVIHRAQENLLEEATLELISAYQDSLHKNPLLAHPVSIVTFKDFLEKRAAVFGQMSRIDFDAVLKNSELQSSPFFSFTSATGDRVAININIKELETRKLEQLIKSLKKDFAAVFDAESFELKIHGFPAVYAQLNKYILQTQFRSFGAAFIVAFCILFYFIGDLRTSFLALLPNILPLCLAATVMAIFKIDLEAANAMLAPIMLGVAMDDTIHLMNKYRLNRAQGIPVKKSMDDAVTYTGGALFSTTIALVCGFCIVGWSGVTSVAIFGLLCAFTILAALVADIIILPALIKRYAK